MLRLKSRINVEKTKRTSNIKMETRGRMNRRVVLSCQHKRKTNTSQYSVNRLILLIHTIGPTHVLMLLQENDRETSVG